MSVKYSIPEVRLSAKKLDAMWTTLVVDQFAIPLTWLVANFTSFSPNQVTLFSKLLGFSSFFFFIRADHASLIIGALLFELSFILDCVDGKLARLKNMASPIGAFFDYVSDRIVNLTNVAGLALGSYFASGDIGVLLWGSGFLILITYMRMFNFHFRIIFKKQKDIEPLLRGRYSKNHTMVGALKNLYLYLHKRRVKVLPSTVEVETVVFFIAPLLGKVEAGFILGTLLCMVLLTIQTIVRLGRLYLIKKT